MIFLWQGLISPAIQGSFNNTLKLDLQKLRVGNASKIQLKWRFPTSGRIRFRFYADVVAGNGLIFFINGNQVGGEWNTSTHWQVAEYNLPAGEYTFDWVVRRQSALSRQRDAVFIKNITSLDIIRQVDHGISPSNLILTTENRVFEQTITSEDNGNFWFRFTRRPITGSNIKFFINGELIETVSHWGVRSLMGGFPVSAGVNTFRFELVGNSVARIDSLFLSGWKKNSIYVTPYCEAGGGDKCIEELIKCLLGFVEGFVVINKKIWLFT